MRRKGEERGLHTAQVSDLCRRRLLSYADSFHELARSYDRQFEPEQGDREVVLVERRLWENRQIISGHLDEMAKIMTEAACEVLSFSPMEGRKKRLLAQALAEEGIQVEGPCYLPREDGRQAIVLTMSTRRGGKVSVEDAADMISVLLDRRLAPSGGSPYVVEGAPPSRCRPTASLSPVPYPTPAPHSCLRRHLRLPLRPWKIPSAPGIWAPPPG